MAGYDDEAVKKKNIYLLFSAPFYRAIAGVP
jgi:hypothetical protein